VTVTQLFFQSPHGILSMREYDDNFEGSRVSREANRPWQTWCEVLVMMISQVTGTEYVSDVVSGSVTILWSSSDFLF
jgi:hypothetical protein